MKNAIFMKIFTGVFLLTILTFGFAIFAANQAYQKDPNLLSTLTEKGFLKGVHFDWDTEEAGGEAHRDHWAFPSSVADVRLDLMAADLEIRDAEGSEVQIEAVGRLAKGASVHLAAEVENGVVNLKQAEGRHGRHVKVIVRLPKSFEGSLFVNVASGDCEVQSKNLRRFAIESVSGDLMIKGSSLESVNAKTVSGDIEIEEQKAANLKLESVSGDISVGFSEVKGLRMELQTVSGEISNSVTASDSGRYLVRIETTSGSIAVNEH